MATSITTPLNPGPPLGNLVLARMIRKAAAAISVTNARYSPCSRSAGRPSIVPITAVISPATRISTGYGQSVAKPSRIVTQVPTP